MNALAEAPEPIGPRIRHYRQSRGLSQAALATRVGVSHATVGGWERGTHPVRDLYLDPLARALGVTVADLRPDGTTEGPDVEGGPGLATQAVLDILEHVLQAAVAAGVVVPTDAVIRLSALASQLWGPAIPSGGDLVTQVEASRVLSVSRQAVHLAVQSGRVKGYPNPERPDRAPMVSLGEVRSVLNPRRESSASPTPGHGE